MVTVLHVHAADDSCCASNLKKGPGGFGCEFYVNKPPQDPLDGSKWTPGPGASGCGYELAGVGYPSKYNGSPGALHGTMWPMERPYASSQGFQDMASLKFPEPDVIHGPNYHRGFSALQNCTEAIGTPPLERRRRHWQYEDKDGKPVGQWEDKNGKPKLSKDKDKKNIPFPLDGIDPGDKMVGMNRDEFAEFSIARRGWVWWLHKDVIPYRRIDYAVDLVPVAFYYHVYVPIWQGQS